MMRGWWKSWRERMRMAMELLVLSWLWKTMRLSLLLLIAAVMCGIFKQARSWALCCWEGIPTGGSCLIWNRGSRNRERKPRSCWNGLERGRFLFLWKGPLRRSNGRCSWWNRMYWKGRGSCCRTRRRWRIKTRILLIFWGIQTNCNANFSRMRRKIVHSTWWLSWQR